MAQQYTVVIEMTPVSEYAGANTPRARIIILPLTEGGVPVAAAAVINEREEGQSVPGLSQGTFGLRTEETEQEPALGTSQGTSDLRTQEAEPGPAPGTSQGTSDLRTEEENLGPAPARQCPEEPMMIEHGEGSLFDEAMSEDIDNVPDWASLLNMSVSMREGGAQWQWRDHQPPRRGQRRRFFWPAFENFDFDNL